MVTLDNLGNQNQLFLMSHRLILKVTKFQLIPPKRFGTVVKNILGGHHGPPMSNRVKMDKICYQPNHPWKGQKAVKKLKELSGKKPETVKQWLSRQAFWQVHLPAPKRVDRPHYKVIIPNEMHQFDLLYIPSDSLYGSKYKYILAGIDAASRYKVARPLRTKQARDVAEMIADIYKVGPLTYPNIFQCDNGSEFKGDVTKMLEKQEIKIRRVTTKYKHTHTAFVEALNKTSQRGYSKYQMLKS